jgi:hypothetical protein
MPPDWLYRDMLTENVSIAQERTADRTDFTDNETDVTEKILHKMKIYCNVDDKALLRKNSIKQQ